MITNELLRRFENNLVLAKYINRQFEDSFGKRGAKIGDTLNIRKPVQFTAVDGAAISIQDVNETYVPLTISTRKHVAFQFSSSELALDVDSFAERYLDSAAIALANQVDVDLVNLMTYGSFNSVGTPGTPLTNADVISQARAKIASYAAPMSPQLLASAFDYNTSSAIQTGTKSLFNPADTISGQYKTGSLGIAFGVRNNEDQNMLTRQVGPLGGTPLVNGANQTGDALETDGWTAAAGLRLRKGDIFTIAGVYQVNPVSKLSTGQLQQFTVTADTNSAADGSATVPISPAIVASGNYQNVTASPADNAAITVVGAPNTLTANNLVFHKESTTLAFVDLPLPGGQDMSARATDKQTGISLRVWRQPDITTDLWPCRVDIEYGSALLRPEWICRIQS